ncbi:MAG: phenylalanine--tRNA ligase subunit alpha [Candidatus Aenigmatarchaeota archaeon]
MSKYILTEEGKKYLINGLPEKNLVKLLLNGPIDLNKAKNQIENFSIAIQWAKKNNWIEIKNNKIFLKNKPKIVPEELALRDIEEGRNADERILSILIQRKLIDKERETILKKAEKLVNMDITNLTEELIKTGKWKDVKFRPYNVEIVGRKIYPGKRQPYSKFLADVRQKLIEIGFIEMEGPTIETEFWNFDALFQPQNHPSRDWTQTYSLKYPKYGSLPNKELVRNVKSTHENGWKTESTGWQYKWNPKKASQLMPRAHDTAISPRYLSKGVEIPGKYFSIVRCYRPDVIDATHGVEFNQMGGFVIAENLNFKHLLGLLKMFVYEITGIKEVKFFSDYYPFTEPSVQISAKHPKLGWMEMAGAGIFREEMLKPLGIDLPVIAWGFGIDRLAMYKLGINDIRYLFSRNLEWIRNQVII